MIDECKGVGLVFGIRAPKDVLNDHYDELMTVDKGKYPLFISSNGLIGWLVLEGDTFLMDQEVVNAFVNEETQKQYFIEPFTMTLTFWTTLMDEVHKKIIAINDPENEEYILLDKYMQSLDLPEKLDIQWFITKI